MTYQYHIANSCVLVPRVVQCVQHGRLSCSDQGDIAKSDVLDSLTFNSALVHCRIVSVVIWTGTRDLLA